MTDDEIRAELDRIWACETSRVNEQRTITSCIRSRLRVTEDMAAQIVAELDTSKPGGLSVVASLISNQSLMVLWRARQKRLLDQRQQDSGGHERQP